MSDKVLITECDSAPATLAECAGPVKRITALSHLNQFDGIDCPGCAWPDPDHGRSLNEYCENGVKAIAKEATAKRRTPEFFRGVSRTNFDAHVF